MAKKQNIECGDCNGAQLVKGLFGKKPCLTCNGLGFLKPNGEPYTEYQAITHFMAVAREQRKEIYYLKLSLGDKQGAQDQHDGRGKNNYRGD